MLLKNAALENRKLEEDCAEKDCHIEQLEILLTNQRKECDDTKNEKIQLQQTLVSRVLEPMTTRSLIEG